MPGGGTLRDHLEHVARTRKEPPPALIPPEFPAPAEHWWAWFLDLNSARKSNGMGGVEAIAYTEIEAWSKLSGVDLTSKDVEAIKCLDAEYLGVVRSWRT